MAKNEEVDGSLGQDDRMNGEGFTGDRALAGNGGQPTKFRVNPDALAALDRVLERDEESDEPPTRIGEFEIIRELGRGGMGIVYEAMQPSMQRRVALKILPPAFSGMSKAVQRFQREAQAAGRLHHTNIVPIYALDEHEGSWYYTMELVEGRPLSAVIEHLQRIGRGSRQGIVLEDQSDSSEKRSTSRGTGAEYYHQLAVMFAGVADALQAATQERIVHRDIKPSNLLLTNEGVLKVVDFGLARFEDSPAMTISGQLLGTPAYMSPEQAMAKRARVDHRTDIYSLGATMYEVLTLSPPFVGKTLQDVCSQIISKDPILPWRADPRIPRDLATIVMKAMEKDPDKRYQSAEEMSRDLLRFAEGDAIMARPIGPVGRSWRRIKRNPVRSSLAAAVVVLAGTAILFASQAASEAELRRMLQYDDLLAQGEAAIAASRASVGNSAFEILLSQGENANFFARAIELDPRRREAYWLRAFKPGRTLEQRLSDIDEAKQRGLAPKTAHNLKAHYLRILNRGLEAQKEQSLADAAAPAETPVDDYLEARLLRPTQSEEAIARLTQAIVASTPGEAIHFLALRARARLQERNEEWLDAFTDLSSIRNLGDNSIKTRIRLAFLRAKLGREKEANDMFAKVLAEVRETGALSDWLTLGSTCSSLVNRFDWMDRGSSEGLAAHPDSVDLLVVRGLYLLNVKKFDDGLVLLQSACDLDPSNFLARAYTGMVLQEQDRLPEAIAEFREAILLRPYRSSKVHVKLGDALQNLGDLDEAIAEYEKAIQLNPDDWYAYAQVGVVLRRIGRLEESIAAHEDAIELKPDEAGVHFIYGVSLLVAEHLDESLEAFRIAIELKPDYADAYTNLGTVLRRTGRLDESIAAHENAVELKPDDAIGHYNLGIALSAARRLNESLEAYSIAIDLNPDYAEAHTNLGIVLRRTGRLDESIAAFEDAIELKPSLWNAHLGLGLALMLNGQLEEAIDAYRDAIRQRPDYAEAHCNLGHCLQKMGRYAEAVTWLRKGHKLGSARPDWAYPSAQWLREAEELAREGKILLRIIRGEQMAKDGNAGLRAANMAYQRSLYATSVNLSEQAFELDPALAADVDNFFRYNAACAAALAGCGQGEDARDFSDDDRAYLREQALEWLYEDLETYRKWMDSSKDRADKVVKDLELWLQDRDFAAVRDPEKLTELPADEAEAWRDLWAEVKALLAQAR